jgi:hypothetical protein
LFDEMTAKMTAKTANGFQNRLGSRRSDLFLYVSGGGEPRIASPNLANPSDKPSVNAAYLLEPAVLRLS